MRDHRRVPGAGTEDHPVGLGDRLDDGAGNLGRLGRDAHVFNGSGGDRHLGLAGDDVPASPVHHVCLDIDGRRRHRQDAPLRPQQSADPVEALNRVVEKLPESGNQQVPERVPVERARRIQAQLHDITPGEPPLGFLAQRRQRHAQVTRRKDRHLLAEPARAAAVVGDRDDCGERPCDVAQCPQGGREAVAAAEGDDGLAGFASLNPAGCIKIGHQSLPMSRCITRTECPRVRRRCAMASEHATERCLPPVQPTAIVTNGFNSAR